MSSRSTNYSYWPIHLVFVVQEVCCHPCKHVLQELMEARDDEEDDEFAWEELAGSERPHTQCVCVSVRPGIEEVPLILISTPCT